MEYNVYKLLKLPKTASSNDIMSKCQKYCERWTRENVQSRLEKHMSMMDAFVASQQIWKEGQEYIKSLAVMLLDPAARECYDAWLDTLECPSSEKNQLMKSRLQWFNSNMHSSPVVFSDSMVQMLHGTNVKKKSQKETKQNVRIATLQPKCRICNNSFSFEEPFIAFHCHCTTRVGHTHCLNDFSKRFGGKCPVCRTKLLVRHTISKYLFWNVRDKYRFI
jgi:hypothetical protein